MKICFLLVAALFSLCSYAQQPGAAEIKKHKIKKITREEQGDNSGGGETVWLYDANGNDTAMYSMGVRSYYKVIDYDPKLRIKKITQYSNDGKEAESTIYTYKPDGSFTTKNTDTQFGLVNYETYDTKGRIVSHTVPDGSVRHYVYNPKGQLIKLYSEPKNNGVKFSNTYTYNAKGNLISKNAVGEYPSSSSYEYDNKGLMKKSTIVSGADGNKMTTVYVYTYEY